MYLRPVRILRLSLLAVIATLLLSGQPAFAHATGPQLVSTFDRISPGVRGIDVNIRQTGTAPEFTVSARSSDQLEIAGGAGEPFLRIAGSCYENSKSLTAFLSSDPNLAASQAPTSVNSSAPPVWRKKATKPSCSWFERRAEWPARSAPPEVVRKGKRATIFRWSIPAAFNGQKVSILGHVDWVPAPIDLETLLVIPLLVVFGFYVLPLRRMIALLAATSGVINLALIFKDRLNVDSSWSLAVVAATAALSLLPVWLLWGRAERGDVYLALSAGAYSILLNLARLTLPAGSFAVRGAQAAAISCGVVLLAASLIAARSKGDRPREMRAARA